MHIEVCEDEEFCLLDVRIMDLGVDLGQNFELDQAVSLLVRMEAGGRSASVLLGEQGVCGTQSSFLWLWRCSHPPSPGTGLL